MYFKKEKDASHPFDCSCRTIAISPSLFSLGEPCEVALALRTPEEVRRQKARVNRPKNEILTRYYESISDEILEKLYKDTK